MAAALSSALLAVPAAAQAAAPPASLDAAVTAGKVQPQLVRDLETSGRVDAIVTFRQEQALARAEAAAPEGPGRPRAILEALRPVLAADKDQVLAALGHEASLLRDYRSLAASVVRFEGPDALLEAAARPEVARISADRKRRPALAQSLPLIRQPHVFAAGFDGAGSEVAVIDSGVDLAAFGCAAPGGTCPIVATADFTPEDRIDDHSHGTNVAGIVHGTAPAARIVALDVFDGFGDAWDADILAALGRVLERSEAGRDVRAVNLSLGAGDWHTSPCADGNPYVTPFRLLRAAGILPVVSAGNHAYDPDGTFRRGVSDPACTPGAVSVGAVYDYAGTYASDNCPEVDVAAPDRVACFSQTASILSLLAPGARIDAAGIRASGTSMAAPHVAGAAAVLWQARSASTASEVERALAGTGPSIVDHRGGPTKRRLDLCAALRELLGRAVCSTAARIGSDLTFRAGPGQSNRVTVSRGDAAYTIVDQRAAISPGPGCARVDEHEVTCAAAGISRLVVATGDRYDRVSVSAATRAMILGGDGPDILSGGPAADHLIGDEWGGAFTDRLEGNGGNDVVQGGLGADALAGGAGTDEARYSGEGRTTGVTVTIDDVTGDGSPGEGDDVRTDIEAVTGSQHADNLTANPSVPTRLSGGNGDDALSGGANADRLSGEGGDDRLSGGDAVDVLDGGPGSDDLAGGPGNDRLAGGHDSDRIAGDDGADVLDGGPGRDPLGSLDDAGDVLRGGAGADLADYSTHLYAAVNVSLDGLANDGARDERDSVTSDVENVRGTRLDDVLSGNAGANRLYGGLGNDWLVGGAGPDALFGEAGEDVLTAFDGRVDTAVDCGTGLEDTAYVDASDPVTGCEAVR